MKNFYSINYKLFKIVLLTILFIEFLSLYAFVYPWLNKFFFILIILSTLLLSWKKLSYGIFIVVAELIITSKGYLFYYSLDDKSISIRLGIFLSVMFVWLVKVLLDYSKHKKINIQLFKSKLFPYFIALNAFIGWGVLSGIGHGNNLTDIFLDVNGWLYFALAFPLFDAIKKEDLNNLISVITSSVTMLIIKTLIIFFIFSQKFIILMPEIYRWIRVTGTGEITDMGMGFYRIFFQSHIYLLFGFFILLPLLNKKFVHQRESLKSNFILFFSSVLLLSIVILSFSRSFWMAFIITVIICYLIYFLILKEKIKYLFINAIFLFFIFVASLSFLSVLINFPFFSNKDNISLASVLSSRTTDFTDEAAVGSRWKLLGPLWDKTNNNWLFGSGYGTTVTYKTEDPRALANNLDGNYTTYSFEWGYLDIWLKLGIFGLIAYIVFIWKIFKSGWSYKDNYIIFGSLLSIIALISVHFFTPYLNHPLGIGYLLILSLFYEE